MSRYFSYAPSFVVTREQPSGYLVEALVLFHEDLIAWLSTPARGRRTIRVDIQEGDGSVLQWAVVVDSNCRLFIYDLAHMDSTPDEPLAFDPFHHLDEAGRAELLSVTAGEGTLWQTLVEARKEYLSRPHK